MIDPKSLDQKAEALSQQLRVKYGLRGKTLESRLNRAGRLLPKRIHKDGQRIIEAQHLAPHPKLAATVDEARLNAAFSNVSNHLNGVDPKDRRKGKLLSWLGGQVFNLMLVTGLLVAVLLWRGFIG